MSLSSATATHKRTSFLDKLFAEVNNALEVLSGAAHATRSNPAGEQALDDPDLSTSESTHAAGLMRINHVGEVCAQALYRGQALVCKDQQVKTLLLKAAAEEVDHLVWCNQRLKELNSRASLLNPLWYGGSFALGLIASKAGVGKNLGFMSETERQVEAHLNEHLTSLPEQDIRSRKIVTQMRDDEIHHYEVAEDHGAEQLPRAIKKAMTLMSKVMTTTAYKI